MIATSADIPSGYKRTEIGLIPDAWEVKQVTDVCGFVVPGRNKPRCFDGDIPWVTTPDLTDGGSVSESLSGLCITKAEADSVGSRVVPAGSVLMSCAGELGIVAFVERDIIINQQLHAFIPTDAIDGHFLKFALKTRMDYIDCIATKTAVPYLNKDNCNSIQIPFPRLAEQEAIAEALGDADAWIESLERLIAKKCCLKQAAMQQLLTGKKRLVGFEGEWLETTLGSLCTSITDGTHYTPRYVEIGVPFYSVENVTQKRFNDTKYISEEEHAVLVRRCRPERYDILMTRIGSLGATQLIDWDVNASIYVSLALLKPRPSVCSRFLYSYTKSRQFVIDVENRSLLNASPKKINMKEIAAVPVSIPPTEEEQSKIADILFDMDAEIEAIEAKLAKARQIKQGMMQELLTGKTRLV